MPQDDQDAPSEDASTTPAAEESLAAQAGSATHDGAEGADSDPSSEGTVTAASAAPVKPFRAPGFLEAAKTAFQPKGNRQRAQPATGSDADAQAINYIDKRERNIAALLSIFQMALGVLIYVRERNYVEKPTKKISVEQAHRDTLSYHHAAPEIMLVNLILGAAIGGAVLTKRRALVGFTLLLGGFGILSSGGGLIGVIYIGVGIWLIFRSMRRNPSARARAATAGATKDGTGDTTAGKTATSTRKGAGSTAAVPAVKKPPPPSKRYTPPQPRRAAPPKVTAPAEPEKENRFASWLKR